MLKIDFCLLFIFITKMNKPIYKLKSNISIKNLNSANLSNSPYSMELLKENPHLINWYILSSNPNAIDILAKNQSKIDWMALSGNINAIQLLNKNKHKIYWNILSMNENAYKLLKDNQDKIDWCNICINQNSLIIKDIIAPNITNPKICWSSLSQNDNDEAIKILIDNQDKIDWYNLSYNTNDMIIPLLQKNYHNINWMNLCSNINSNIIKSFISNDINNPNIVWSVLVQNNCDEALHLITQNQDKIDKYYLYNSNYCFIRNINYYNFKDDYEDYFELDYDKMKKNFLTMDEEIIKSVLHPRRVMRYLTEFNWDIDDMFD
jgi:hypothetical protein